MPPKGLVIPPDSGITDTFRLGEVLTWKLTHETSLGVIDLAEMTVAPRISTFEHIHGSYDEIFYILEGNFRFKLDEEELQAGAGSTVFIPRTTSHAWICDGPHDGKVLLMFTPAGMDGFFHEMAELNAAIEASGGEATERQLKAMEEISRRYQRKQVGSRFV